MSLENFHSNEENESLQNFPSDVPSQETKELNPQENMEQIVEEDSKKNLEQNLEQKSDVSKINTEPKVIFQCQKCLKCYSGSFWLDKHKEEVHTGEKMSDSGRLV